MKIAVTGGNGRVGQTVIQVALAQGHHVVCIDRALPDLENRLPELTYSQADLTSYEAFAAALQGCEALIHLAAIPAPGRHSDHEVHNNNVVTSYNALRAAAELKIWRVCQASSVNALGGAFSRKVKFDYLPLDEEHPTYNEDPYSLSKWICEQQADSFTRRYEQMQIASLRLHWAAPSRKAVNKYHEDHSEQAVRDLWGYVDRFAAARAFLLGVTAVFGGHEVFYIVAPKTGKLTPSLALKAEYYADVPLRGSLEGNTGFYNCAKAERILGWTHDLNETA